MNKNEGHKRKVDLVTKINFREKVAQNVDLVHFSIGHFICSGAIKCDLVHFSIGAFECTSQRCWHGIITVKQVTLGLNVTDMGWRGGLVVGRRTCDLVVAGSRPGCDAAAQQP